MNTGRILLTGASGFVGTQIREHLHSGAQLHCTTSTARAGDDDAQWHFVDLRDRAASAALIRDVRPDMLIHCAWNTAHGEFWDAHDNEDWLEAGKALFSAFADSGGCRIVGFGTCAEYSRDQPGPHREDEAIEPYAPATRYGRAKLALLRHLEGLGISHGWARIFLAYGEGEDSRRLIPSVLRALLSNQPAKCSSGKQLRDLLDVRDIGAAIAKLAFSDVEGVINLGSGAPVSIGEVAKMLGEIVGRPDLVQLGALPDRPGEAPILIPDTRRQTDELGFIPGIDLRTGLDDAARYWSTRY